MVLGDTVAFNGKTEVDALRVGELKPVMRISSWVFTFRSAIISTSESRSESDRHRLKLSAPEVKVPLVLRFRLVLASSTLPG